MRELYEKNKAIFSIVAFFIFWGFVYAVMPSIGKAPTAEYGDTQKELLVSLFFGLILAVFATPLATSAWDAFKMFFTSPIFKRRWKKFKTLKRGYYSFIIIVVIFGLSLFSELMINNRAIFVKYQGQIHFTLTGFRSARQFGMQGYGLPNFRLLKKVYDSRNTERAERIANGTATEKDIQYKEWGDDWVLLPIYPYGPLESLLDEVPTRPPHPPTWSESAWRQAFFDDLLYQLPDNRPEDEVIINEFKRPAWVDLENPELYRQMALAGMLELKPEIERPGTMQHILGTDDRGRDVFARMVYGFRTSVSFALLLVFFTYIIGISVGAVLGYFGGTFDILVQRLVEVWSAMPFLYTVMIFASIMIPNFWMLVFILVLFSWMGMTYYIRAEFLREIAKDYVAAAKAIGCTDGTIIFKHILPNALTPVISFAPFAIVAGIGSLVSLDFLGFGLPAPTPSWGELLGQGLASLNKPWLILSPTMAMFVTLLLVSFIGEAIREAFDPKQYSRLR